MNFLMMIFLFSTLLFADSLYWRNVNDPEWLPPEEEAKELWKLHDNEKWNELRPKLREYMQKYPNSYSAHALLGRLYWQAYGEHSRALHHMFEAKEIYEEVYLDEENEPFKRHSELLYSIQSCAGDMNNNELELQQIAEYNSFQRRIQQNFGTSFDILIGEHGWPFMKQGKYDEAIFYAKQAIDSGDDWQKSLGLNVMCAVTAEQGKRLESLKACEDALEHGREYGGVAIDASNASNSAISALQFDKAEEYAIEGSKSYGRVVPAWLNLNFIYLLEGKGPSMIDAFKGLYRAQMAEEAHLRSQRQQDVEVILAQILLLAGQVDDAMMLLDRAMDNPDRRGAISTSEEQTRGSHAFLRYVTRKVQKEREIEELSCQGWWGWIKGNIYSWLPDFKMIRDRGVIRGVLMDEERLLTTFRIYIDKGLSSVPSWILPNVSEILGEGVTIATIEDVQKSLAFQNDIPQIRGYHDAIRAEVAFLEQDAELVLELGKKALDVLPQAEVLSQIRVKALMAWASKQIGDQSQYIELLSTVMNTDPSVIRRLGLDIPVMIEIKQGGMTQEIADKIVFSPRFYEATDRSFTIQIEGGEVPTICLLGIQKERISCVSGFDRKKATQQRRKRQGKKSENPDSKTEQSLSEQQITNQQTNTDDILDDDAYIQELIYEFHTLSFGLPMGTTGSILGGLDGSTTRSRESLQSSLKDMVESSSNWLENALDDSGW